jgi:hypothetical protein
MSPLRGDMGSQPSPAALNGIHAGGVEERGSSCVPCIKGCSRSIVRVQHGRYWGCFVGAIGDWSAPPSGNCGAARARGLHPVGGLRRGHGGGGGGQDSVCLRRRYGHADRVPRGEHCLGWLPVGDGAGGRSCGGHRDAGQPGRERRWPEVRRQLSIGTSGTSAAASVTIDGSSVRDPTLDGNHGSNSSPCSTGTCDGPVLTVTNSRFVVIRDLTIKSRNDNTCCTSSDSGGGLHNAPAGR